MKIRIINQSQHELPTYGSKASAGVDLRANIEKSIRVGSLEKVVVPTGLFIEIPIGYEAQVRPRSGLAFKHGITVLNSPGTIDADYRGQLGVVLINHGIDDFHINHGDRIAQIIFAPIVQAVWKQVTDLDVSSRDVNGFGSTGIK